MTDETLPVLRSTSTVFDYIETVPGSEESGQLTEYRRRRVELHLNPDTQRFEGVAVVEGEKHRIIGPTLEAVIAPKYE